MPLIGTIRASQWRKGGNMDIWLVIGIEEGRVEHTYAFSTESAALKRGKAMAKSYGAPKFREGRWGSDDVDIIVEGVTLDYDPD